MNNMSKQSIAFLLTGSLALAMVTSQHVHAKSDKVKPASRSTELVVDPDFNFESSKSVVLDISVTNDQNRPMPGVMLKVYAVEDPKYLNGVKRKLKTALISMIRTDANGNAQRTVEVPQHYRDIKIEKMMLARYTEYRIRLEGQERVVVDF